MTANEIRKKYIHFFSTAPRDHVVIPSAPIISADPSTLFNSSGMQPLVPYLLGQSHPMGKRLVDSQKSFRAQDIDEVGDKSHTTFFEMLGNWSLGDYFKKEQLSWFYEFLTKELHLDPKRLYVTVFAGNASVPKDDESIEIWKSIGMPNDHIFTYDAKKNWWSRSGTPEQMAAGEPGGPDSEVFYDFGEDLHFHETSLWKGETCHPNCQCGRFMEIGNSVFMQYQKLADGSIVPLPQRNVDFGGGLERLNAAVANTPDIFKTDFFSVIIEKIEHASQKIYGKNPDETTSMRVISDHMRGAVMMITDGVVPSNKQQGYMLRKLIRRSMLHTKQLGIEKSEAFISTLVSPIANMYSEAFPEVKLKEQSTLSTIIDEGKRFEKTIEKGLKEIEKMSVIDGKQAFILYETYGFPWELTEEIALHKGQKIDRAQFEEEFKKHQELSRTASAGMFKGGLADHSVQTTRLHTAHHLVLAALQKIVDSSIHQRGSNITAERLRMDFNFTRKIELEELRRIEDLVNEKITENLPIVRIELPREEAEKIGAQMEFGHKYPETVSVYFIGPKDKYFSAEFCGGPHVSFTGELGHLTIDKEETAGAGIRRIYAHLTHESTKTTSTVI